MQKKYTNEEKQEKFNAMIKHIKEQFGTQIGSNPNSVLEISNEVFRGIENKNQEIIVQGLAKMVVCAVVENKFSPDDYSYSISDYFKGGKLSYTSLLEDFNARIDDFKKNGRGVKLFLGVLAGLTIDPFEAMEVYVGYANPAFFFVDFVSYI